MGDNNTEYSRLRWAMGDDSVCSSLVLPQNKPNERSPKRAILHTTTRPKFVTVIISLFQLKLQYILNSNSLDSNNECHEWNQTEDT